MASTMDEKLIEAVREYTCLWQVSSRAYKYLRAKENAVAQKVRLGFRI